MDLAALAGLVLDPWQEHVLRQSLGERPDGRWSAFEVGLVVPRQNGKNAILEARELAGLFLFGEQLIIHSAHEFKTAQEAFLKILQRFKETPDLLEQIEGYRGDPDAQLSGIKTSHGAEGITLKNGNRLRFAARSGGSGRGFTGDLIIFDEAYALTQSEMAAMLPTMAARSMEGNPQLWYTSSAGMPNSEVLADLRERGAAGRSERLAYLEWSVEDGADPDSPAVRAEANPGYGIRISEEFIQSEREAMGDEEFKRERLGIWAKLGGESVIPDEVWSKGYDADAEEVERVAFAVDVPPSRDSAVISMAGFYGADCVSVVVIDQREGTSWVPSRLAELKKRWSPVAVVVDAGSAAGTLLPAIKAAGVKTKQVNMRDVGSACGRFYDYAMQGKLKHTNQKQLTEAVEAARQRPLGSDGSSWAWSRKNVLTDISPLVAATLALHGLESKPRSAEATRGRAVFI